MMWISYWRAKWRYDLVAGYVLEVLHESESSFEGLYRNSSHLRVLEVNSMCEDLVSTDEFQQVGVTLGSADRVVFVVNKDQRFTGFYGNPDPSQRVHSWTLLQRLHGLTSLYWLCGRDFNEIMSDLEKIGGLLKPRLVRFWLRRVGLIRVKPSLSDLEEVLDCVPSRLSPHQSREPNSTEVGRCTRVLLICG
ncbi:hypothetical protein ACOSQ3_027781 [Xanthoceras sorbifolium]